MRRLRGLAAAAAFVVLVADGATAASTCYGTTAKGRLAGACQLPKSGPNFAPYTAEGIRLGRTYVHCEVAEVVVAAYASLARQTPGVQFVYGETGKAAGGDFSPHKTHQNGLSVDFFVPVRDQRRQPTRVPAHRGNRWGYDLEFDSRGRAGELAIDFEALARHLLAVALEAEARGVGIRRVYFHVPLQKHLERTSVWPQLRGRIPFSTTQGWWRHDEHYHIDFQLPCRPL